MTTMRSCRCWFVALALASLAGCARTPQPAAPPALVGAWQSTVQFSTGAYAPIKDLELLYVFNAGGTMTESSNYDAVPPVPPAYGEWVQVGATRFDAKYTFFTTNPPPELKTLATGGGWLPAGTGVLTEQITMAPDGRSYDSSLKLQLFDKTGKPVPGGGEATAHARRAGL